MMRAAHRLPPGLSRKYGEDGEEPRADHVKTRLHGRANALPVPVVHLALTNQAAGRAGKLELQIEAGDVEPGATARRTITPAPRGRA